MHRIDTPTAQKDKFGAGKNGFTRGNPQTGTPATELDDDYFDMLQEELATVVEATGVALDKAKRNQLLTALNNLFPTTGRLLNVQTFTSSGTYTRTPGMRFCIVKGIGGGGAGGGAPATASGNVGLGAGGHAGAYGEGQFTAAQIGASQTVTVGSGGTGSPTSGGNGGSSSLGSLITFGGGMGASSSGNTAPPLNAGNGNASAVCTGANIISGTGQLSIIGQITSTSVGYSGTGANSPFGAGGGAINTTGNGVAANGYGAGGSGACAFSSNATARSGGNGSQGFVIIFEYS